MSGLRSYSQHEQIRKGSQRGFRKDSLQPGESSWFPSFFKVQPGRSESARARADQATPTARASQSPHLSKPLDKSRTLQEDNDNVPNRAGEQERRKRPRPPSTSNPGVWITSATRDELLEKSSLELSEAILNLRVENEQLKASNEQGKLKDKIGNTDDHLIQRYVQLEETLAHVRIELIKEKENSAEIEKKRKRAVNSLAMITNFDPYYLDDNHFEDNIETFRYSIDHWVRNQPWQLAEHPSNQHPVGPDRYEFLKCVSERYKDYTNSKRGLESIVLAHIWRFFLHDIFGQDAWGEIEVQGMEEVLTCWKLKKYFTETVSNKYIELRHEWRVASARLMKARESELVKRGLDNAIIDLSHEMECQLQVIAHQLDSRGLKNLIRDALELDASMQQQRIFYKFFPKLSHTPEASELMFSEKTMDIVDYNDKKAMPLDLRVKLVLVPGLMRYGNAAGKEYTKRNCILRAEVQLMGDDTL